MQEPWKKFCNFRLDNPLFEARLLFWQVAQMKLTGFLYWNLNAWEGNADADGRKAGKVSSPNPHLVHLSPHLILA